MPGQLSRYPIEGDGGRDYRITGKRIEAVG